jgi:hypothetical protein
MTSTTMKTESPRWVGIALTAALAVVAYAVQWGVVTARLAQVEKRLDELIVEARGLRAEYQTVERRVAYLEGRYGLPPAGKGVPQP